VYATDSFPVWQFRHVDEMRSLNQLTTFLRYPGSKRRMLAFLSEYLPASKMIAGRFIEPFVGGGAIYFHLQPKNALLADLNPELIDLYRGIVKNPERVWRIYRAYQGTSQGSPVLGDIAPCGLQSR
jgi:site-specific DNA-adenine methylase